MFTEEKASKRVGPGRPLPGASSLDVILNDHIGTCGKFQKRLIWYIALIIGPLIGFNLSTQLLILLVPPHLCESPHGNATHLSDSVAVTNLSHSHTNCQLIIGIDEVKLNTTYTLQCPDKREFDHSIVYPTLVSENNWVCDDHWKALLPHVIFRAGAVFGVLCIGVFSDQFGRVPTSIICFTIAGVAGLATIFSGSNFTLFLICRALVGFVSFKGTIPMILVTEYVGPQERAYVATGLQLSVGITNITLPWIAYFIRDWRILAAFTSGAMFIVPVISAFTPESVRWLMSRCEEEKTQKAKRILKRIANINGVHLPDELLTNLKKIEFDARESIWRIFRYTRFVRMFTLTTIIWIIIAMVSWGGNLYVAILTDHPFLMISINSTLDVLATMGSQMLANCFGRRKTVIVSGTFTFACYLATALVDTDEKYLFLALLFLGRIGVTIVYNVKYLYAAELFPTAIRSRAMALRLSLGSMGGLMSPYILTYTLFGKSTPLVIYGVLSGIASFVMIFLPETLGKSLPDTLMEANDFGLKESESVEEIVKQERTDSVFSTKM